MGTTSTTNTRASATTSQLLATHCAMTVEQCLAAIDARLGPLDEQEMYRLSCQLAKLIGRHVARATKRLLTDPHAEPVPPGQPDPDHGEVGH